jgi:hypothetical protein
MNKDSAPLKKKVMRLPARGSVPNTRRISQPRGTPAAWCAYGLFTIILLDSRIEVCCLSLGCKAKLSMQVQCYKANALEGPHQSRLQLGVRVRKRKLSNVKVLLVLKQCCEDIYNCPLIYLEYSRWIKALYK